MEGTAPEGKIWWVFPDGRVTDNPPDNTGKHLQTHEIVPPVNFWEDYPASGPHSIDPNRTRI